MRTFYLKNEVGETFMFGYGTKVLVSDVSGLGFVKENTYLDYNNIFLKSREKNPTSDISLMLNFIGGYLCYKAFLSYIERSDSFYLYYKSDDEKYIHCEVEELTKTQLFAGAIISELRLRKLSYWFKDVTSEIRIDVEKTGKIYPYLYPYKYSNSSKGRIRITNNGYAKAPLRFLIKGAVNNPEIIVNKDGEEVSRAKIYYESENCTIEIDAFPTRQKIEITSEDGTFDGYGLQDFQYENFIMLGKGDYELLFIPYSTGNTKCIVTMIKGYLGN